MPKDRELIVRLRRGEGYVEAADRLEALQVEIGWLREGLGEQTSLVERLCDAVDRAVEDIGGEGALTVLALLGPVNDKARTLLTQSGKDDDRG